MHTAICADADQWPANPLHAYGYADQASAITDAAGHMRELVRQLEDGEITGEEVARPLSEVSVGAGEAMATLDRVDQVEF
jgi:hypothetical protein